jgi:uncharacterized membrane protein
MSLKAIELQIALPRTHDAGKIQENIHRNGQTIHDVASDKVHKEQEKRQTTVFKQESKDITRFKNSKEDKNQKRQKKGNHKNSNDEVQDIKHPYKGTKIDFSG